MNYETVTVVLPLFNRPNIYFIFLTLHRQATIQYASTMSFRKTEVQKYHSGLVCAVSKFWLSLLSRTEDTHEFKMGCLKAVVINTTVTAEVYAITFT